MNISSIAFIPLEAPLPAGKAYGMAKGLSTARQSTLVRLTLVDGIEGWGEAWGVPAANLAFLPMLQAQFVGTHVLDVEQGFVLILARNYHFGVQGPLMACISGIDIAAKDAAGKMLGVPVHRLLGGKRWDSVPVYASGGYMTEDPDRDFEPQLHAIAEAGHGAAKIKIGLSPASDEARVRTARRILGDHYDLLVDINSNYTVDLARASITRIAPYNIGWIEEPLMPQDHSGYEMLQRWSPVPIATGEAHYTGYEFKRLLDRRAVDVLQPDLTLCGGFWQGRVIATLAAMEHVRISPHVWGSGVGLAAAVHFTASLPSYPHAHNVALVQGCCLVACWWRWGYFPSMPFKHNAARRHRIPRARYRVTNWPAYEAGLRRRSDLTLWLDEAALAGWAAPKRSSPGGQPLYSELAIELVLTLRLVFHLALRQAEAFSRSVLRLLGLALFVPDHTTLSRRGRAFAGRQPRVPASSGPVHLVLDSTGLELFGQGEWDAEKHGRARRQWRKLHLAVNAGTGEIAAHVLTEGHADDAAQVPALLGQVKSVIASVTADGAYDGEPTYAAAAARQRHPPPDVVVPPRASAVPSSHDGGCNAQSQRDRHVRLMAERGRMGWQKVTGYGRRNQAETAMFRYKHLIGPKLRARSLPAQRGEAAIAVAVLNTMIRTAKPVSVRVA